jgi:hypothetical protein
MDYENQAMLITYGILKDPKFDWDGQWSKEMKSALLKILINYFEKEEQYEKCSDLQNMLADMGNNNEYIDKEVTK